MTLNSLYCNTADSDTIDTLTEIAETSNAISNTGLVDAIFSRVDPSEMTSDKDVQEFWILGTFKDREDDAFAIQIDLAALEEARQTYVKKHILAQARESTVDSTENDDEFYTFPLIFLPEVRKALEACGSPEINEYVKNPLNGKVYYPQ